MSYSLLTSLRGFTASASGSQSAADAAADAGSASASGSQSAGLHDDGCGDERSGSDDEWTSWRRTCDGGYGYDGPYLYYYSRLFFYAKGEKYVY